VVSNADNRGEVPPETNIELVVSAGPDLGARVSLGPTPIVVGRERSAELRLTDLAVSRRHLEVRLEGGRLIVSVVGSAAPFSVAGQQVQQAELQIGDKLVVGKTALSAVQTRPRSFVGEGTETCEVTDVRSLLGDMAVGALGLGAIFELSEHVDKATGEKQLERIVGEWADKHVETGTKARIERSQEAEGPGEELVERTEADSGKLEVTVPLIGVHSAQLVFVAPASIRVSNELRRLLAVSGRVVASSLARIRTLGLVREQATELRRLAVGSAESFLGSSAGAKQVAKLLERLARSDAVALLVGETGAGKSFLARLIHEASPRAAEPLRVINCAAIPDNLVEAELFGHERGAFTGAAGARQGALEAAGKGTVLLDEIGDLPLTSQAKLLRVLEEKQFERLGSNRTLRLEARVLAATNRDLKQMVQDGSFRSDLFFRISVISVPVPSLRERQDDIKMLAERFLADLAPSAGRRINGISAAAHDVLRTYSWPGNVRELRNVIEHALVLGDGPTIEPSDLPPDVAGVTVAPQQPVDGNTVQLPLDLATLEQRAIEAALQATNGNRTKAAALLGINRVTLYKKLKVREEGEGPGAS